MRTDNVLIIDDDQALVTTLKEGLESQGFKVATAYDGLQGVFQARQNKPAAIILDFNMPAGGGVSVYQRLRSSQDTVSVPIIFLTGVTVQEVKEKIHSTPYTYFLRKPASLNQLCTVLEKVLGHTAQAPQTQSPSPAKPGDAVEQKPLPKGQRHEFELRVSYGDTDKLGLVYYANYLRYFEQGRTELLRSLGIRYRDLEEQRKLYFPVVEARCEYLAPCRYDDSLVVRTWLAWMGPASLCFQNEIYPKEASAPIARGFSRHAVLDASWKPVRLPKDLKALLAQALV